MNRYVDYHEQYTNLMMWFKDNLYQDSPDKLAEHYKEFQSRLYKIIIEYAEIKKLTGIFELPFEGGVYTSVELLKSGKPLLASNKRVVFEILKLLGVFPKEGYPVLINSEEFVLPDFYKVLDLLFDNPTTLELVDTENSYSENEVKLFSSYKAYLLSCWGTSTTPEFTVPYRSELMAPTQRIRLSDFNQSSQESSDALYIEDLDITIEAPNVPINIIKTLNYLNISPLLGTQNPNSSLA